MALNYLLDPVFQIENSAGKPATDGWLEVYIHGTRTKYYCASDFNGTLHPFKIPLDSLGSNIVLAEDGQSYDVYAYNRFGSLLMSRYNVTPGKGGGSGGNVGEMQHWLGMYGPTYTPFPGDLAGHTLGISKWDVDYVGDFIDRIETCPYPDGTTPRGYIYLKPGLYFVSCIIRYQQASDALSNTLDEILIYTGAGNANESLAYQMDSSGPEATGNRHNVRVQFIRRVPENVSSGVLYFAPGTPVDWKEAYIQKLEIVKLDSVAVSPTIVQGLEKVHHDGTLIGDGTVANPLGIDSDSVQKKLTAGEGIEIDSDGVIRCTSTGQTYTAGENINIDSDNVISATGLQKELTAGPGIELDSDGTISVDSDAIPSEPVDFTPLVAGHGITIEESEGETVISAAGEAYSAGYGIVIDSDNVVSVDSDALPTYTPGEGINIDSDGVISVDSDSIPSEPVDFTPLVAGANINIEESNGETVISANVRVYTAGENIEIDSDGVISAPGLQKELIPGDGIDLDSDGNIAVDPDILPEMPPILPLVAGENVTIEDSDGVVVISASGGGESYSAGSGINIDSDGVISVDPESLPKSVVMIDYGDTTERYLDTLTSSTSVCVKVPYSQLPAEIKNKVYDNSSNYVYLWYKSQFLEPVGSSYYGRYVFETVLSAPNFKYPTVDRSAYILRVHTTYNCSQWSIDSIKLADSQVVVAHVTVAGTTPGSTVTSDISATDFINAWKQGKAVYAIDTSHSNDVYSIVQGSDTASYPTLILATASYSTGIKQLFVTSGGWAKYTPDFSLITSDDLVRKQDKLTAGTGINISELNVITADLEVVQKKLTAGDNINLDSDGVISAELPQEEEVEFEELDLDDYQTKLTAGYGIDIDSDGVISYDGEESPWELDSDGYVTTKGGKDFKLFGSISYVDVWSYHYARMNQFRSNNGGFEVGHMIAERTGDNPWGNFTKRSSVYTDMLSDPYNGAAKGGLVVNSGKTGTGNNPASRVDIYAGSNSGYAINQYENQTYVQVLVASNYIQLRSNDIVRHYGSTESHAVFVLTHPADTTKQYTLQPTAIAGNYTLVEETGGGGTYTAGGGINIDSDGEVSVKTGSGVTIDSDGALSAELPEEEPVQFEEFDDSGFATKAELASKADSATTLAGYGITDAYTKTEVGNALADKADSATTLAGYGITDAYTKTQVDNALNDKQNTLTGITDVQVVQSLPASPVATVLYLIPEV